MIKLDRSKPFGKVTPPFDGAAYSQDGRYFNGAGEFVFADPGVSEIPEPAKPELQATIVTTVDADGTRTEEEVLVEVAPKPVSKGKQELIDWLTAKVELTEAEVTGTIRKEYSKVVKGEDAQIDFLVNTAQLVPAENVRI